MEMHFRCAGSERKLTMLQKHVDGTDASAAFYLAGDRTIQVAPRVDAPLERAFMQQTPIGRVYRPDEPARYRKVPPRTFSMWHGAQPHSEPPGAKDTRIGIYLFAHCC